MGHNKIVDKSNDEKYFTIAPRLVWALSRSPYDYTLWCVVKDIAGTEGQCILSTPDLADLAMMSAGKVSDCRQFLLNAGLLDGELRQDPGYPQPVWHLSVPDLWKRNVEWCEKYPGLKSRVSFKFAQKESLHLVKASPGEKGVTPGEKGVTPGETKKIHKEKPKEEQVDASPNRNLSISIDGNGITPISLWRAAVGETSMQLSKLNQRLLAEVKLVDYEPEQQRLVIWDPNNTTVIKRCVTSFERALKSIAGRAIGVRIADSAPITGEDSPN